ncbi:UDP-N-acetylmuramoyl-L-alanine--D-glutamate ligase [Bacteroidales bacterium OttesenSCG-928-B11]|nr:UDP-N-acetylmuramoyl-L-alanine--D-glutamate ligase [Bacteroidales bacterium OttesenSCG-928-C03]MDL2311884.1 UDP-N-acetylmuramoyl-L-alanine--D-glutamate ligase [Bacteroidales bacterium OttesenSCG-928-B11]MDL2326159.1 UDP-N-acetylmuramoyl-L-alanine--D-glutamate ligase [Bacteroidales bacterium OttesenSCG-928-A14]
MNTIRKKLEDKKIVILGFGKEGLSTYKFIRAYQPELPLVIADQNGKMTIEELQSDVNLSFVLGDKYDENLNDFDLILKSPGVSLANIDYFIDRKKLTSQTSLFVEAYRDQVIGITGTKGKSTTASLIYHILKEAGRDVKLAGNIGVPFFDIVDEITPETIIVAELSAHQLEFIDNSPHIAILLNIFQEHLDHFTTFNDYQLAKLNITNYQKKEDYLIYNQDDLYIGNLLRANLFEHNTMPFRRNMMLDTGAYSYDSHVFLMENKEKIDDYELGALHNLPGKHNYYNVMAAILVARLQEVDHKHIVTGLNSFQNLEHRIEYVGIFNEIKFYNDSISTIPETTIAAVNTLRKVQTLILGGFDRGIDYQTLIDFLAKSEVKNIAFTGPAGKRIFDEWQNSKENFPENYLISDDYHKIVNFAFEKTSPYKICVLSPAAASYDQFENFEARGRCFKDLVLKIGNNNNKS